MISRLSTQSIVEVRQKIPLEMTCAGVARVASLPHDAEISLAGEKSGQIKVRSSPTEPSDAAVCYVRNTSICDVPLVASNVRFWS